MDFAPPGGYLHGDRALEKWRMSQCHLTSWGKMLTKFAGRGIRHAPAQGVRVPQASAMTVRIKHLADHPEVLTTLATWLEAEWPSWYGPEESGDAYADLARYSNHNSLPVGLIAFRDRELCGFAALKTDAISGYEGREPWAGAAVVPPELRNHGVGSKLLRALENKARELGYESIFAGTSEAFNLLRRQGWQEQGQAFHNGADVYVYEKAL